MSDHDSAIISVSELRETLARTLAYAGVLTTMLDELAQLRAKERLRADSTPAVDTDDLPPDAATGLYLDRPFDADDLEWLKMAWDALRDHRQEESVARPTQLMLVFQTIRRDDRATREFLRVMNTVMLPLLRRLRLRSQPELARLGAAHE